jgi:hypothetical protein
LEFKDKRYCFTGTFQFGHRWECEIAVEERGGSVGDIARCTDYLVIGSGVTDSWMHSTFGRKINRAKVWIDQGASIAIVSEEHWVKHIRKTDGRDFNGAPSRVTRSRSYAGEQRRSPPRPDRGSPSPGRSHVNRPSSGLHWFVRFCLLFSLLAIIFRVGWNLAG